MRVAVKAILAPTGLNSVGSWSPRPLQDALVLPRKEQEQKKSVKLASLTSGVTRTPCNTHTTERSPSTCKKKRSMRCGAQHRATLLLSSTASYIATAQSAAIVLH